MNMWNEQSDNHIFIKFKTLVELRGINILGMLLRLHHAILKLMHSKSIENEQCLVYMLLLILLVCSHVSVVLLLVEKLRVHNRFTRILGALHHHLTLDKTSSHSFMHSFPSTD